MCTAFSHSSLQKIWVVHNFTLARVCNLLSQLFATYTSFFLTVSFIYFKTLLPRKNLHITFQREYAAHFVVTIKHKCHLTDTRKKHIIFIQLLGRAVREVPRSDAFLKIQHIKLHDTLLVWAWTHACQHQKMLEKKLILIQRIEKKWVRVEKS